MIPTKLSFDRLKRVVSVERFLGVRGLAGGLRHRGDRLVGPCPIHRGDNPTAFVVDLRRNLWYCFTACGTGGDVVDLVRRVDRCSWREAAHALASMTTCDAPFSTAPVPPEILRPFLPFTRALRLAFDTPFLRARGISADTARRHEAGAWEGPGFLAGCVAVRLHDPQGGPLGYAGRRLDATAGGRWKLPPGFPKSRVLYNVHRLPSVPAIVLVEGPWDVMRLSQIGIPAVALLGTHLSAEQRALLRPFPRIAVLLDGDAAGRRAADHVVVALRGQDVVRLDLPPNRDPADLRDDELLAYVATLFPL